MVSDRTYWYATMWVVAGILVSVAGEFVAGVVRGFPLFGELLFTAVWLVALLYAVKFALYGVGVLVSDIVAAELDRKN